MHRSGLDTMPVNSFSRVNMTLLGEFGVKLQLFAVLAVLVCGSARAAEPPLNDSVRDIREIAEAVLSPDGRQVAATILASTAEGGQPHLWMLSADGKSFRQLTFATSKEDSGERGAAFSHDGQDLYFRAKRGKVDHLMRLPLGGGEAQRLVVARDAKGELKSGWNLDAGDAVETQVRKYDLSPDGKHLVLLAQDADTAARKTAVDKKDDAVRVGVDDSHKVRAYRVEIATGKAWEIPLPDDATSARWNDAGDELVIVTAPEDQDNGWAGRVWRYRPEGGAPAQLENMPASANSPAWTADGKGLIYLAQAQDDAPPGTADLYVYDLASKASRNLTRGLKGSLVQTFVVERDGKSVVTPVLAGMRQRLARIRLADGALTWLDGPQPVVSTLASNPRQSAWAMLASGATTPKSVYLAARLGGPAARLAAPAVLPAGWPATPSELVSWTSDGLAIEGLLYLPPQAKAGPVPLVVNVHGGPAGQFLDRNSNLVNLLIAQGWAVLQPNPRGSTGYGTAFAAANKNDLGGGDYRDIMAGVDAVLAKYPIDPARLALIGYSYGGEMAGFVVGKTDRFKALVSGAPVIDQFSEYGTEDSSWYDRWYYGKPWDHFADAWRQSPLAYVAKARTPFLLLQGEEDPTDPLGQSQEMRRALSQVGAPVVLVTYPRETHATLGANFAASPSKEPWHGADLRRRMIAFIQAGFDGKDPTAP
jgi:dipeptidyl aminopeptidase/acylaminoacyl peptidase